LSTRASTRSGRAVTGHHLVYVHGICRHDPGYSNPWWEALKPNLSDIPDANHHEVLWSDVITPADHRLAVAPGIGMAGMAAFPAPPADPAAKALALEIRDVLTDRAERQQVHAALHAGPPETARALAAPSAHPFLLMEPVAPQALFGLPDKGCIDDFTKYLLNADLRNQVIARFDKVVRPLLAGGASVEVISHSWGTVVAYEALRRLDTGADDLPGQSVHTLFTAGAALAIGPVKRRLLPEAMDGHRPRVVRTWVNLNAQFDIVGGPLRGNPFAVDFEYLNLPPVGCSVIIPNPSCAHGSYFRAANETVNRDIFAKYIGG
jgi:hypothetical protein